MSTNVELNINPDSELITLNAIEDNTLITIIVNGGDSSNSSFIDSVGILTVQNNPIIDNDNINTFASKTQGQIDSLAYTKADRPNGVTTGGEIETGVDYITVSSTQWMIGFVNYSAPIITFSNIALSSSGNQRYIAIYGDTNNTINKLEGNEASLAVYPDLPSNTIIIGYVLVGDGVISSPAPDLSAYATTNWVFNWSEPKILRSTRTTNYRLDTPNHPSQIIRNGGTVDIGIQCYYTDCKINGTVNKIIVVKPNQLAFIKAIQNNDDNYFVFVVDEVPTTGGGIPEPTVDGNNVRTKSGSTITYSQTELVSTTEKATWNGKQDILGFTPANKAGDTFTGNISASNLSGSNTGDETSASIRSKLGQSTTSTDGWLSSTDWNIFNGKQTALGFTPVTNARTISINGTTLDLTANRSWIVGDVLTSGSYSNPSWIANLAWSKISSTPTTLTGYGITDGWRLGGNALSSLSDFGSTTNFGISFIVNSVKQIELLPITSSVAYLSLFSGTSANGTFNISVKNNNSTTATQLKLTTSSAANTDSSYILISGSIQMAPNGSVVAQFTQSGLQTTAIYGYSSAFNIITQSGNPSTTTGSGGIILSYRNAAGTFSPTAGLYRNVQIGGVSGAFQPTGAASYIGIDLLEQINQTSGTGAITYININPTITSNTGVVSGLISNIASGTNRYNLNITGTAINYLAGNTSIGTTTVSSLLTLGGSTTARSSLRLLAGTSPTTPNDGDIWYDGTNIYLRVGSTTKMFTTV